MFMNIRKKRGVSFSTYADCSVFRHRAPSSRHPTQTLVEISIFIGSLLKKSQMALLYVGDSVTEHRASSTEPSATHTNIDGNFGVNKNLSEKKNAKYPHVFVFSSFRRLLS